MERNRGDDGVPTCQTALRKASTKEGKLSGFSIERLMRLLRVLGRNNEITVKAEASRDPLPDSASRDCQTCYSSLHSPWRSGAGRQRLQPLQCASHGYRAAMGVPPIGVPITSPEITISTRRFCCRPEAVSLEATG